MIYQITLLKIMIIFQIQKQLKKNIKILKHMEIKFLMKYQI
jgi:hypothetical protein